MNEKELREMYIEMQNAGFSSEKQNGFLAELGCSKEIPYHYELIRDAWLKNDDFYKILGIKFERHSEEGLEFLYEQLKKETDINVQVNIAYLAAQMLNYKQRFTYYKKYCDLFLPYLISYTDIPFAELRRKAIIVLGWIGREEHIDLLLEKAVSDPDHLCRTWSASSLMQMSFHGVSSEVIKQKSAPVFLQVLTNESDLFACGVMIESVQTLYSKRWISGIAVDSVDSEKIEKARKTAVRVLSRLLKDN